jgi:hypothetical protein
MAVSDSPSFSEVAAEIGTSLPKTLAELVAASTLSDKTAPHNLLDFAGYAHIPAKVTGVTASWNTTLNKVMMGWDTLPEANEYIIEWSTGTATFANSQISTSEPDTVTVPQTGSAEIFYSRIKARNAAGVGPVSNTVTTTIPAGTPKLATPTGINASSFIGTDVVVSWTAVPDATAYDLTWYIGHPSTAVTVTGISSNSTLLRNTGFSVSDVIYIEIVAKANGYTDSDTAYYNVDLPN